MALPQTRLCGTPACAWPRLSNLSALPDASTPASTAPLCPRTGRCRETLANAEPSLEGRSGDFPIRVPAPPELLDTLKACLEARWDSCSDNCLKDRIEAGRSGPEERLGG